MTFFIASVIVFLTFIFGALLAWAFKGWDRAVVQTKEKIENEEKAYNPALTLGHSINSQADAKEQIKEARKASAKQAAALPRGANMRIGYKEDPSLVTASKGLDQDPWTASKIAQYHGWDGAKTGIPAGGVPAGGAVVAAASAPAAGGKVELVPGKDYPVIEITDDMSADEKRKARIANSKAKSAAMKKAKAAGATAVPGVAPTVAAAVPAAAAAPLAVGITPPKLIAITDDMPADEMRKARIANSKAKSAFNKQLKAAGIDPKTVEIDDQGNVVMPQASAVPAGVPETAAAPSADPAAGAVDLAAMGIAAPQLVAITDDMPADEMRQARINNSKAKSAFNKQLKAAGIDPKLVEIDESGNVVTAGGAATAAAAPSAAPTPAAAEGGSVDLAAMGITPPELIELTDDMSPDEIRQARIANSKAKSAFNKKLKAAGIDPKSVEL